MKQTKNTPAIARGGSGPLYYTFVYLLSILEMQVIKGIILSQCFVTFLTPQTRKFGKQLLRLSSLRLLHFKK